MAKYRPVYKKMWKDPDFQKYTPQGKLLFIYLCTNESTTESGIYPITPTTISRETGLSEQIVTNLLHNLKNVLYDEQNNFVFLKKFRLYNTGGKPELVAKAIVNDFLSSPQTPLWSDFIHTYAQYQEDILSVGQPLDNGLLTVTQQLDNSCSEIRSDEVTHENQPLDNGLTTVGDSCGKIPINIKVNDKVNDKVNITLPEKNSKPILSNNPLLKEMQIYLGYPDKISWQPIPNIGKELGFIKTMHERGLKDEDIIQCWKQKVDYMKGKFVSLHWVNNDIGDWLLDGKVLKIVNNNGHKKIKGVPDDEEQINKFVWESQRNNG
jgi:hypothetical protein